MVRMAEPEESLREKRRAATGAGVCALAAAQGASRINQPVGC